MGTGLTGLLHMSASQAALAAWITKVIAPRHESGVPCVCAVVWQYIADSALFACHVILEPFQ